MARAALRRLPRGVHEQNKYNRLAASLLEGANRSPQTHCSGAISKIYSTQSLILDLSQKLLGQTARGLRGDAVEDQMATKLSPPHTEFLSPTGCSLGVQQGQPRALTGPLLCPGAVGWRDSTALTRVP